MECKYQTICGGCPLRYMEENVYRQNKLDEFSKIVSAIWQKEIAVGSPIFIADGLRRRAEFTFQYKKNNLQFGFNAAQSHDIADIDYCVSLSLQINKIIPKLKLFLAELCKIKNTFKVKNKIHTSIIDSGEMWVTQAANGLDIILETEQKITLEHRMLICEFVNSCSDIIRFSFGAKNKQPETIIEKNKPYINVYNHKVFIAAGTFLQASNEGQQALIDLVLKYIGNTSGNIADLFCGIGTFSYPLSDNIKNKITAVDSSAELLSGFQQTVNFLTIPNIKIINKNLFKYPLDGDEIKNFEIIVFDPPRAGAAAQVKQIASVDRADKPQKIIAISCNPHTFVNDANVLLNGGYYLKEITLVDQFVFSKHFELVALFEKI